jgi:hypothetical protein
MRKIGLAILFLLVAALHAHAGMKVTFRGDGTCLIDGKPFFPIGIWVYGLSNDVFADLHDHHFNTIVGVGFAPTDIPAIEKHGMMCIPSANNAFLAAAKDSPSLLGWYLMDEPEEHQAKPEDVRKAYVDFKVKEKDHPIGITHNQRIGPPTYKGASDFTMTDVYPVTAKRDWPLKAVGDYTSATREVHGESWPTFTFVQTFGGPDTDGGLWAQPTPSQVRFMAFNALVHRANGILYFSHWPRAPITWSSIRDLNRDIRRIVPWLIAEGEEVKATVDNLAIEVRARKVGSSWIVIATNTEPKGAMATFTVPQIGDLALTLPYENRVTKTKNGAWRENFDAHEAKVYVTGDEPAWP